MINVKVYPKKLIKTKYVKPELSNNLVQRQRISKKMDKALEYKLMLVSAPAGFGKSIAVLEWIRSSQIPAAWFSLGKEDNTPIRFWQYIYAALDSIIKDISIDTEYLFSTNEFIFDNTHLSILIDRLTEIDFEAVLVLDDFHLITEAHILDSLNYFINYMPPNIHLILISRTDVELNLANIQVKGQLVQLDLNDLRFQASEIKEFFEKRNIYLKSNELKSIANYSEGWAVALVATTLNIDNTVNEKNIKNYFAYCDSFIEDYFNEEIFKFWTEEKRNFFLKTVIVDTFCESLCSAITDSYVSKDVMEDLVNKNGFIVLLDYENHWYMYNHLFKRILLKSLNTTNSYDIAELNIKAACWYEVNGYKKQAIKHFLDGACFDRAVKLIDEHLNLDYLRNDYENVFLWLNQLPKEYKENNFKFILFYAIYYAHSADYKMAWNFICKLESILVTKDFRESPDLKNYLHIKCIVVKAMVFLEKGEVYDLVEFINITLNSSLYENLKLFECKDANLYDIYYYRSPNNKFIHYLRKVPEVFKDAVMIYSNIIKRESGYSKLIFGEYYYETNKLDEALPYLLEAMEEATNAECLGALVPIMVNIARIRIARGDRIGAFETINECEIKLQNYNKSHWKYIVCAYKARMNMDNGEYEIAEQYIASRNLRIYQEITIVNEFELIVFSRILLARKQLGDAEILLKRLLIFSESQKRLHSTVEILNLLAILAFQNEKNTECNVLLEKSLLIGIEEGYVRSFVDELEPMAMILERYLSYGKDIEYGKKDDNLLIYAQTILNQTIENISIVVIKKDTALEPITKELTIQEKNILRLLVDAYTNQEIAEQLGITLRTVKAHTSNVYIKLGVKTRAQCTKRAVNEKLI